VVGGDLYFLGGGHYCESPFLLRYDAWHQKWEPLEAPIFRIESDIERHVTVHQGAIFMVGSQRQHTPHTVSRYDPGGHWELMPVLPIPRRTRLISCNGILYSLGCIAGSYGFYDAAMEPSRAFERLDSSWECWQSLPALTDPVLVTAVCDGELWPVGTSIVCMLLGIHEEWHEDGLGMCWTCDTVTLQWSRCQNMPTPRRLTKSCVFRGAVYVFDGCEEDPDIEGDENDSDAVEFFVPASGVVMHPRESEGSAVSRVTGRMLRNRWSSAPDILHGGAQSYLVPADNSCVFSVGGCFDDRERQGYTALDCYIPEYSGSSVWEPLASLPRCHMCGVAVIIPRPGHHRFLCE